MIENNTEVEALNGLLSWELSAAETYSHAIDLFCRQAVKPILDDVRADHLENARGLRAQVELLGGPPATNSEAWAVFLASVKDNARLFGERSALVALLQGEETGRAAYEQALQRDGLPADGKELIRSILMPRLQRHISTLRELTATR
jgi:hypothetical protein